MHAIVSNTRAPALNERRGLPPHASFQVAGQTSRRAPQFPQTSALTAIESFEPEACRRALLENGSVLRPSIDRQGRTIILTYAPGGMDSCDVFVVSMLYFGDGLRQRARAFGMGNLAARVCQALVENGSLRGASKGLGISHQTARSEIADAMRSSGVNNQCGLVGRMAEAWLSGPLSDERAVDLLRSTFGLTPRDAKVAALRAAGFSRREAARALGLSQWAMEESSANLFTTLGVAKAPELTRILADLLLASDLAEGLERAMGIEPTTFSLGS